MRVSLDEELELKIARFIKGLCPGIAKKVDVQPYLSFDDVCHLAIKVGKQLKGRKPFQTTSSIRPQSTPKGYSLIKLTIRLHLPIKALIRVRGLLGNYQRGWRVKSVSNTMVIETFKWIVPSVELLLVEKWKKFKPLKKQLVRRKPRKRIKL